MKIRPAESQRSFHVVAYAPEREKPRHGYYEDFVPDKVTVRYDMRQYPADIAVLLFMEESRTPLLALSDDTLECRDSSLAAFLRPAFINRTHLASLSSQLGSRFSHE